MLPCLAAASRHWRLGHVLDPHQVAFPLAAGAVLGSIAAGQLLGDIPPDPQTRFGVSAPWPFERRRQTGAQMVIFAYGAWSLLALR